MPDTEILTGFWSWQTLLFCLAIYVAVFIFRRITEGIWVRLRPTYWWGEVVLPILPPLAGLIIGYFARGYPYPTGIQTVGSRVIFGIVAGFFSGWSYRIARAMAKKMLKSQGLDDVDLSTLRPPPAQVLVTISAPTPAILPPAPPPDEVA